MAGPGAAKLHRRPKVRKPRLAEREMIAGGVTHPERPDRSEDFSVAQRQPVRRVIAKRVRAALRLQQ